MKTTTLPTVTVTPADTGRGMRYLGKWGDYAWIGGGL